MVGRTPKRNKQSHQNNRNHRNREASHSQPSPPESRPPSTSSQRNAPRSPTARTRPDDASVPPISNSLGDGFDISGLLYPGDPLLQSDFLGENLFDSMNDSHWVSSAVSTSTNDSARSSGAIDPEVDSFPMPFDPALPVRKEQSSTATTANALPPLSAGDPCFFPRSPFTPQQNVQSPQATGDAGSPSPFAYVVALCKMISLLEDRVQSKSATLDEVMRLNKACIKDVTKILAKREYMQCQSCPALVSTILELIVTLYEEATRLPSPDQQVPSTGNATESAGTPSLQFGVFELDPEEQTALRNRIICKEAQKCHRIIQMLKRLPKPRAARGSLTSSQSQALGQWYEGMEKRMNDIISVLLSA